MCIRDSPHALHELAQLHQDPDGKIAAYNEVYARDLYTQAAQLGYAPSQCKLGEAYASGTLACPAAVSYTHLRAHETSLHLVCRLLLEKKKK